MDSCEPFVLPREQIVGRLRAALHQRVVLVEAATGSGKSTLARLAARAGTPPVVCVRLDPRAADASFFFRQILPALDLDAAALDTRPATPIETVGSLAAALSERPPFVLVLDDAEVLGESAPVLEIVMRLAEQAPPGVSLLLLTSSPLPLRIDGLRDRDEVTVIRDVDLALGAAEAEAFLAALAPGVELDGDALARLLSAVRGRIGALALFGTAIRDEDPRRVLDEIAGSAKPPIARLVDRVLARFEPEQVAWLEQASVLEDFSPDLLREVAGDSASAATVMEAAADCRFLDLDPTPSALSRGVREALRQRLHARPEAWRRAHQRAAAAWEARGESERVFHHRIEAGQVEEASRILAEISYAVLTHNRIHALEQLIERLPAETIEADPFLCFCRGAVRLVQLRMADARDDSRRTVELADSAGFRPLADVARARLCFLAAWQGDFPAMACEAEWIRGAGRDLHDPVALAGQAMLEMACRHLGRNDEADALAAEIDALVPQYPAALAVDNSRAMNARLAGDYHAERMYADRCLAAAREGGVPGGLLLGLLHTADSVRNLGRPAEALEVAKEAASVARSLRETWWEFTVRNVRIAALRDLGRIDEARQEGRVLLADCREHGELHWVEGEVWLTLASLPDEDSAAALAAALRAALAVENPLLRAQVRTEIARDAVRRGDEPGAAHELDRAEAELGTVRAEEVSSEIRLLRASMAIARSDSKGAQAILSEGLREGPALRRERHALLPALVPLALRGDAKALAQVEAEGVAALPVLARIRGRAAEALTARVYDAAAGPLDVEGLGAFRVARRGDGEAGGEPIRFRTPRVADLFRLLLVASIESEAIPRDVLLEALWPEARNARATFHTHLAYLRRALEPHLPPHTPSRYVLRSDDGYRLDLRGGSFDAERFRGDAEAGLAAARAGESRRADALLSRALAVYRGPLFAEHLYTDAFAPHRRRIADLFTEAGLAAAGVARQLGDLERARAHLERLVSLERDAEAAWVALMEVATERGHPDEIPRLLDRCRAALRAELDREPLPETLALAARLRGELPRAPEHGGRTRDN